jgi:AraC family transcriptional regulator, melibiose operon regulatory protein
MTEPYFEDASDLQYAHTECPFYCHVFDSNSVGFPVEPHWHLYVEILYFIEGEANVYIAGSSYQAKQGDMILVSPREVHAISAYVNQYLKYVFIKFHPDILFNTLTTGFDAKHILPFILSKSPDHKHFRESELAHTAIPSIIHEISRECWDMPYGFEFAVRSLICRFYLWVMREWNSAGWEKASQSILREIDYRNLQNAFIYLDEHFYEDVSAEHIASICNMSYSNFSKQFKKVTGKSFVKYLNYIRVTEAEKLLLTQNLDVTEIALKTGFSDTSYFIKQFKQFKNMTPYNYRKKALGI